jgi:hypothetical protein
MRKYLSMKHKFRKLLEPSFIVLFILGVTVVNLWHIIYHALNSPSNTLFIGISHHYEDYFYYLSQLTQGAQGAWGVRNLYTTEPIPSTPLWWTNIMLGKISGIFHLPPWTVYDIALFLTTAVSLYFLYWAARKLYPTQAHKRIATFLIAVLATCAYTYESKTINPITYFYNYTSSLNRLGGVVHLMLQNIFSLIMIFLYADILEIIFYGKNPRKLTIKTVLLSFTVFLLAFINPVYIMVDAAAMAIVTLPLIFIKFKVKRVFRLITVGLIIGLPLIIPVILLSQTFNIPFYQYFRWWESSVLRAPDGKFFYSYGVFGILLLLGIIPYLIKTNLRKTLGLIWAFLPLILYWTSIPQMLSIPYFRLPQPPSYIILGALVVEFIWLISRKKIIFWLLVIILLAYQIPMLKEEIRARTENYTLISWMNHLDKNLYQGLLVLKTFPRDKTVLAFNNLELMVPAITGQQVYAAHRSLTLEYPRKIGEVAMFYTNQMTPDAAVQFLKNNHVGWVLWKKADGDWTAFEKNYPFLTKWYENPSLIIYKY